jgi:hypothetical protein
MVDEVLFTVDVLVALLISGIFSAKGMNLNKGPGYADSKSTSGISSPAQ